MYLLNSNVSSSLLLSENSAEILSYSQLGDFIAHMGCLLVEYNVMLQCIDCVSGSSSSLRLSLL